MKGDTITLEQDGTEFVDVLSTMPGGASVRHAMYLPSGFTAEEAREALLVTGHVLASTDALRMISDLPTGDLCSMVEEMLSYFRAPGVPSQQLLGVVASVNAYDPSLAAVTIPWLAYAWLDVVVRDDLADQARSARDIWQKPAVEIECQATCERRIHELHTRYAAADRPASRMAPSVSTRSRLKSDDERMG